jgi:hypothetical protein
VCTWLELDIAAFVRHAYHLSVFLHTSTPMMKSINSQLFSLRVQHLQAD